MDLRFLLSGSTLEKREVKIVKKGSKAIGNFEVYPNYVLGFEFKQDADGFGRVISGTGHCYWDEEMAQNCLGSYLTRLSLLSCHEILHFQSLVQEARNERWPSRVEFLE